jgi:HEAT repeat protein
VAAALVAAPRLGGQSLADRVSTVKDGAVQVTYAARPDACGDGNDVTALGKLFTVYPSIQGRGWSNMNCTFGPARVVVTKAGGEVTGVRTHIGAPRRAQTEVTDLGTVPAREAATYFLGLASSLEGRAASSAVMAAAVADSTDIWRQLLALARNGDRSRDVRSTALYWLSGVAPADAVTPLTEIARNANEPRTLREGVLMTLGQMRDGAGVPSLIAMTKRDDGEHWLREKAIFWLGDADDERARTIVRAIASSDTTPRDLRDRAIFALGFLDHDGDNGPFLRTLYTRLDDRQLKDKVIQAVAQLDDADDERWLLDRVLDATEPVDLRKQALFWRGQHNASPVRDLIALYPRLDSRELREHYVFVLSQRHESAAVDKLIDLASNDGDREIRAKATFWLGQSRDPKAMKFLEERINK